MSDLATARAAYDARNWKQAFEIYRRLARLDLEDLDRFAVAAMLLGRMADYYAIRERAYREALQSGAVVEAALAAFWAGMQHMVSGELAEGGGWLARAERLVSEDGTDSVAAGFLRASRAFEAMTIGDLVRSLELLSEAVATGRRLESPDLVALALHQRGLVLVEAGHISDGMACLDEAMLEISSGAASPMVTGIVYCGAIAGCWSAYEINRAQSWTASMSQWCAGQPELVNFRGECKVRRAELRQLQGEWPEALAELHDVTPEDIDSWAAGMAAYVRGNLDRLQGRFDAAEEAFAEARRLGTDPQPGLALLRLAQGSVQAAAAMARRCVAEVNDTAKRVEVLSAATEILIAAGDTEAAGDAVHALEDLTVTCRSPVVVCATRHARAALHLAEGRADQALPLARSAMRGWTELTARHHEACSRVLIAQACRLLGDRESAERELDHARERFAELGAAPDLARLQPTDDLLTTRELDVLRLVATGATNKAIAEHLVLSERTIDRHVSNIFAKLGVSSRAAATAYAFERQLL